MAGIQPTLDFQKICRSKHTGNGSTNKFERKEREKRSEITSRI